MSKNPSLLLLSDAPLNRSQTSVLLTACAAYANADFSELEFADDSSACVITKAGDKLGVSAGCCITDDCSEALAARATATEALVQSNHAALRTMLDATNAKIDSLQTIVNDLGSNQTALHARLTATESSQTLTETNVAALTTAVAAAAATPSPTEAPTLSPTEAPTEAPPALGDSPRASDCTSSPVTWGSTIGVAAGTGTLEKSVLTNCGGTCSWDAGAISTQVLSASAAPQSVSFKCSSGTNIFAGLGNVNTGPHVIRAYNTEFAVSCGSSSTLAIYESGVSALGANNGKYALSDVFTIQVTGTTVTYYQNNAAIYTSANVATFPLQVDTSILNEGAGISDVVICTGPA
jgi:hypothetical protein